MIKKHGISNGKETAKIESIAEMTATMIAAREMTRNIESVEEEATSTVLATKLTAVK